MRNDKLSDIYRTKNSNELEFIRKSIVYECKNVQKINFHVSIFHLGSLMASYIE